MSVVLTPSSISRWGLTALAAIATSGCSFGSLRSGNVAQKGLSEDFVAGDLTVVGSLPGGGDLGAVDLVYIPEPASLLLLAMGSVAIILAMRSRHAA